MIDISSKSSYYHFVYNQKYRAKNRDYYASYSKNYHSQNRGSINQSSSKYRQMKKLSTKEGAIIEFIEGKVTLRFD